MVSGLGGIAWLSYMNISSVEQVLMESLNSKISIIKQTILQTEKDNYATISAFINLKKQQRNIFSEVNLRELALIYKAKGYTGIEFLDYKGKKLLSGGSFIEKPDSSVTLNTRMLLMWKNGYWLRLQRDFSLPNSTPVKFISEIPLDMVNKTIFNYRGLGETGYITLCAKDKDNSAICFPNRFSPNIYTIPYSLKNESLPTNYSLSGRKGIVHAKDFRNQHVIAAYGSLNPLPLGMVSKITSAEIYKPIMDQLKYIFPTAILFICGGLILLYWQVAPLVRKVVSAENNATVLNKKLEKTVKKLNQKNYEISLLRQLSEGMQTCLTTTQAFQLILKYVKRLLPNSAGILYFVNKSHTELIHALHWGMNDIKTFSFQPSECHALKNGKAHVVINKNLDLQCNHVKKLNDQHPPLICMPLTAQGKMIGVIYISNKLPKQKKLLNEILLLTGSLCEQIAIGISNILLREKFRDQSLHDALTGLYNRRYLDQTLPAEFIKVAQQQEPLSILMLDIDLFKNTNDRYGHDAGDAVLVALSRLLRSHIRTQDFMRNHDFVCRYGGEEFIMILSGAGKSAALEKAEKILHATRTMVIKHKNIEITNITISIGLAVYPENGHDPESLIKAADIALYYAKNNGRNRIEIYDKILT